MRYSDEWIAFALWRQESGMAAKDVCQRL